MSHDSIRAKLRDPGFTAGRRDVAPMLELLAVADEDEATKVVRSLAAVGLAAERAEKEWALAAPPLRHRLVALAARARGDGAESTLLTAIRDADPRTRKAAARGLGRLQESSLRARAAARMRDVLAHEQRPEVTRAILEALGKVGNAADAEAVAQSHGDASTERVRREAKRRIERSQTRSAPARIVDTTSSSSSFEVELRCREGLESILAGELPDARIDRAGRVMMRASSLREIVVARTWSSVGLVIYRGADVSDATLAELIAGAAPLLRSLTEGIIRWRVEWLGAGHRRAATGVLGDQVAVLAPELVNDPIASDWEIEIARERGRLTIAAIPKSWDDGRFSYRVADVPAASHPTIAAAIVRAGSARDDDVVWDPFVGSGLELVERARMGRYRSLLGTDTDERALAAARKNLDAARVRDARLEIADARTFRPGKPGAGVTLVLTNPPMGRRVKASPRLDVVLGTAIENVVRALEPGGRFVWITPNARATNRILEKAHMKRELDLVVDMHGFAANLQRWTR
jgi:predicted RNA methylase